MLIKEKKPDNQQIVKVDLNYITDLNVLQLSIVNLKRDTVRFSMPKILFQMEQKKVSKIDKDIIVKSYIPQVFIEKTVSYLYNGFIRKKISSDSTMQREERELTINLPPKERFVKEIFLNCGKSDAGNFLVSFLTKENGDIKNTIKIKYPVDDILKIDKN